MNRKNALVIGATGLLGYGITLELDKAGWNVKALGRENLVNSKAFPHDVEYISGDFYDETFLHNSLKNVDKVFFFLSSTFPSTSSNSLELEISRTLKGLDYLLRKMKEREIPEIVFPSSGGTIYGNVDTGFVKEADLLRPTTPYGVGKKMCEDVLQFYSQMGISTTVLRVGNVYGTPLVRRTTQGVIDVFVQKALKGETATIWGDALHGIRDYIFVDDFSEAVVKIGEFDAKGVEIYNLSSGIGTTLKEIIHTINKYTAEPLRVTHVQNNATAAIKRIVLDMEKFKSKTGWQPKYNIDQGIKETINRKIKMKELL